MGLAYCILAHKNPAQVARLLRAIWHPDNIYVLHYEKRAPRVEHHAIGKLAKEYANVRILPSRPILWGRYSQVAAQVASLELCLRVAADWTHFFTLSGQDFPLQLQQTIVEELSAARRTSFVSYFEPLKDAHWRNARERLTRVHIDSPLLELILRIPGMGRRLRHLFGWTHSLPVLPLITRKKPSNFRYFGGSNHVILSREAASYIVFDPAAKKVTRWLQWSGHPDESVFQTTLLNSHLANTVINDDRRAIFWAESDAISPRILTSADFPRLGEARQAGKLFARKFDSGVDEKLIDEIESDLQMRINTADGTSQTSQA